MNTATTTRGTSRVWPSTPSIRRLKFGRDNTFHAVVRERVEAHLRSIGRRERDCPEMYAKTAIIFATFVGRLRPARLRRDCLVASRAAGCSIGAGRRRDRFQRDARREPRRLFRFAVRESAHEREPRPRRRQLALLALEARGFSSHVRQRRRLRHRHQPRGPRSFDAASPARVGSSLAALVCLAACTASWR